MTAQAPADYPPACSSFALRTKLQSPPAVALRPAAGTVCGPGPRARGPAGPRAACPARRGADSAMRRRYAGHGGRRRSRPGDHALGLPATRTSPPAPDYDTASPPRHTPAFHPSPPRRPVRPLSSGESLPLRRPPSGSALCRCGPCSESLRTFLI